MDFRPEATDSSCFRLECPRCRREVIFDGSKLRLPVYPEPTRGKLAWHRCEHPGCHQSFKGTARAHYCPQHRTVKWRVRRYRERKRGET